MFTQPYLCIHVTSQISQTTCTTANLQTVEIGLTKTFVHSTQTTFICASSPTPSLHSVLTLRLESSIADALQSSCFSDILSLLFLFRPWVTHRKVWQTPLSSVCAQSRSGTGSLRRVEPEDEHITPGLQWLWSRMRMSPQQDSTVAIVTVNSNPCSPQVLTVTISLLLLTLL